MSFALASLARPYAEAAYAAASADGRVAVWGEALARLAAAAEDPTIVTLVADPRVARDDLARLLLEVAGHGLPDGLGGLIGLLLANERIATLPEVARLFHAHQLAATRTVEAEITTALALTTTQEQALREGLARRFQRDISLRVTVDPALRAGAIIQVGDQVIDGSLQARLTSLAATLTH